MFMDTTENRTDRNSGSDEAFILAGRRCTINNNNK